RLVRRSPRRAKTSCSRPVSGGRPPTGPDRRSVVSTDDIVAVDGGCCRTVDSKEERMRTIAEMVAEAKSRVKGLSPSEVAAARDAGTLLVDLREPEERAAKGTIAGAVFAPRGMLEFWADPSSPYHRPEFDPEVPLVLYCAS